MSLTQPEDYLRNTVGFNLYWGELLRTVDEFDQLIELGNLHTIKKSVRYRHV